MVILAQTPMSFCLAMSMCHSCWQMGQRFRVAQRCGAHSSSSRVSLKGFFSSLPTKTLGNSAHWHISSFGLFEVVL